MTLAGLDVVLYTISFVVPGFVFYWILAAMIPVKQDKENILLLKYLTISCVNYAFWSWLIFFIRYTNFYKQHPRMTFALAFLVIFLSPAFFAFLTAKLKQTGAAKLLLEFAGFNSIHAIPTAWEWKFSTTTEQRWVIVTLKDGATVAGWYSSESFASSEGSDRDLYIEKVYTIQSGGAWVETPRTDGILILKDNIRTVEFFT